MLQSGEQIPLAGFSVNPWNGEIMTPQNPQEVNSGEHSVQLRRPLSSESNLSGGLRLDGWVQPLGPHGRLRLELLKVCHQLQQDDLGEFSRVSVRALYRVCREALLLEATAGTSSIPGRRSTTSPKKRAPRKRTRDSKGNKI